MQFIFQTKYYIYKFSIIGIMKRLLKFTFPFVLVILLLILPQFYGAGSNFYFFSNSKVGLRIGKQAPNFELPLPDGKHLSLSDLHGKMVLIDFWASWCKGCRLKQGTILVYNQFKDSKFANADGFTIVSVSLDKNRDAWLAAIEKDGLVWPYHVCDYKSTDSPVYRMYKLSGIPRNWLVDAKGVIIAKDIDSRELTEILTAQLKP